MNYIKNLALAACFTLGSGCGQYTESGLHDNPSNPTVYQKLFQKYLYRFSNPNNLKLMPYTDEYEVSLRYYTNHLGQPLKYENLTHEKQYEARQKAKRINAEIALNNNRLVIQTQKNKDDRRAAHLKIQKGKCIGDKCTPLSFVLSCQPQDDASLNSVVDYQVNFSTIKMENPHAPGNPEPKTHKVELFFKDSEGSKWNKINTYTFDRYSPVDPHGFISGIEYKHNSDDSEVNEVVKFYVEKRNSQLYLLLERVKRHKRDKKMTILCLDKRYEHFN